MKKIKCLLGYHKWFDIEINKDEIQLGSYYSTNKIYDLPQKDFYQEGISICLNCKKEIKLYRYGYAIFHKDDTIILNSNGWILK